MDTRMLGPSGIQVSPMGLGCWAIGGPFWDGTKPLGWGEVDDAESTRAIRRGLELGVTFFDTADLYGTGRSERVLGRALAGRRDDVVVATKFGNTFDEDTRQFTGTDVSPAYVRAACEASLRRLGTDRIDLYQLHVENVDRGQAAAVQEVLEALADEGKIRAYAWSTDDPALARLFAGGPRFAAVQHELNVLNDVPEMLALCEELGLASIDRGPLGMGLLTGKFRPGSRLAADDIRGTDPDWMTWFRDGRPAPEWLERVPIPGFRTVAQVEENAAAMAAGPLTAAQLAQVGTLLAADG
jgi:aryl-alcohol dehydrogenase-like predicted oxidoreductase